MIKTIAIVVAVMLGVLLVYAAFKPATFQVVRSANLKATPQKIFPLINDFHQWEAWSPWEKIDPNIQRTYSGAASGVGSIYEWNGNSEIGHGRMEIIESMPDRIVLKLDFIKPMEAHNTVEFTLTQQGDESVVSQAMHGPSPYFSRLMTVFFSMDKMIGSKFEEGLANLKVLAEQ